eukprot:gene9921-3112_t
MSDEEVKLHSGKIPWNVKPVHERLKDDQPPAQPPQAAAPDQDAIPEKQYAAKTIRRISGNIEAYDETYDATYNETLGALVGQANKKERDASDRHVSRDGHKHKKAGIDCDNTDDYPACMLAVIATSLDDGGEDDAQAAGYGNDPAGHPSGNVGLIDREDVKDQDEAAK